jgi:competence protein ComEA
MRQETPSELGRVRFALRRAAIRRACLQAARNAWATLVALRQRFPPLPGKILVTVCALLALAALGSPTGARLLGLKTREALAREPPPQAASAAPVSSAGAAPPPVAATSPTETAEPPPAAIAHSARATPEDPVYVNEADATELRRLPGIGAKRADAILALRARKQKFTRIEELLTVKGIGPKSLAKLRPLIRLTRPTVPAKNSSTTGKETPEKGNSPANT